MCSMHGSRVNHNSNKVPETIKWSKIQEGCCIVLTTVWKQLFRIVMEQQSYDRIYVIWITRIESTRPRVVCNWNTNEVKERKFKIHYEGENKETCQTVQFNKPSEED